MKTWNWKWIRRVVLILLSAIIVIMLLLPSSYDLCTIEDIPRIAVKFASKNDLDSTTIKLMFGAYETFDPSKTERYAYEYDEFIGFAFYYCGWADSQRSDGRELEDYKAIENHDFIYEIPADELDSGRYGLSINPLNHVRFQHTEKLSIPREILEKYNGNLVIKVLAISSKDGKFYSASSEPYLLITYKVTESGQVVFID